MRSEFKYKGLKFFNSEQAFMWEKAIFFNDIDIAEEIIKFGHEPKAAKHMGRQIKGFDAQKWSEVCFDIMVNVNYEKYSQSQWLKETLLETENKTIVEASPVDLVWGIGIHWENDDCLDESKWRGQNLLGKALMEVRKKLNYGIKR